MNKAELIAEIESNGYTVLQERLTGPEDGYSFWTVAGVMMSDGTATRKWFKFYERMSDGECFWADKDPFRVPPFIVSFRDELNQFVQSKINSGIILAGYVDDISEGQETAIVRAVVQDGVSILEKRYLISKDANGNPKITAMG